MLKLQNYRDGEEINSYWEVGIGGEDVSFIA